MFRLLVATSNICKNVFPPFQLGLSKTSVMSGGGSKGRGCFILRKFCGKNWSNSRLAPISSGRSRISRGGEPTPKEGYQAVI